MGSKHNKKRFFCVKYNIKPDGKFDELIELSRKKVGSGKMADAKVVLDLINQEVLKLDLPGTQGIDVPFNNVYQHFRKHYADAIDQFLK